MADEADSRPKDVWDKLSILSGFLASVLVPVAVAVVGNWYTTAIRERETAISERDQEIRRDTFDREWVQLALEILRDPDTESNIRRWAVQIISNYAQVPMENEVKDALEGGAVLPEARPVQMTAAQQQIAPDPALLPSATSRVSLMDQLQTRGIEALLARDIEGALAAYDEAYAAWPTFRNVDEIRRALIRAESEASARGQEPDWAGLYRTVAGMDLRGVSPELRKRIGELGGG